eukprot:TRINITY_DN1949_c0_g1_i2.p1 TRINITY_DN1949_c0_g1~~TRINITY_DN1949_c0_g1_i2.p1  ORF type:complete len:273 (-),score=57.54 TRINITY_DN1949_c0_g1_i2:198-1016(-)
MSKQLTPISEHIGKTSSTKVSYNTRDLILYAIGIGCDELKYVYENDSEFTSFPTYPIVLNFKGTANSVVGFPSDAMLATGHLPPLSGTRVILDGERYLEVITPLPAEGDFTLKSTLVGISKRGQGALVETETVIYDDKFTYVKIVSGAFLVGAKDFVPDKAGTSHSLNVPPPNRPPDAVEEVRTLPNQAHIYRLSGDYNPLHIDPSMAQASGFKKPILHGLCTLGHAAHVILRKYGNNDPVLFKSIRGRFAKPVEPGEQQQETTTERVEREI